MNVLAKKPLSLRKTRHPVTRCDLFVGDDTIGRRSRERGLT